MTSSPFRWVYCRAGEKVVICFFSYTALLSLHFCPSLPGKMLAALLPLLLLLLAGIETRFGSRSTSIARDWVIPVAVLAGYWQMGLFGGHHSTAWQDRFLAADHFLLYGVGLRALIESCGPLLPWLLELSYSLLYAIPGICIGILYAKGARPRIDKFLQTFALGSLLAYALLPVIPVGSPRVIYPAVDLPSFLGVWRAGNTWLLDHLDIGTSVFPSGHVAVAFSCALGFYRALPRSRGLVAGLLILASAVFVTTIYGRYHYAADGTASIVIALTAWALCEVRSFDILAAVSARVAPEAPEGEDNPWR